MSDADQVREMDPIDDAAADESVSGDAVADDAVADEPGDRQWRHPAFHARTRPVDHVPGAAGRSEGPQTLRQIHRCGGSRVVDS